MTPAAVMCGAEHPLDDTTLCARTDCDGRHSADGHDDWTGPRAADRDDHHGRCSNRACACWDPTRWPVCEQWQGIPETGRWCPRCGWAEHLHPEPPDIEPSTTGATT